MIITELNIWILWLWKSIGCHKFQVFDNKQKKKNSQFFVSHIPSHTSWSIPTSSQHLSINSDSTTDHASSCMIYTSHEAINSPGRINCFTLYFTIPADCLITSTFCHWKTTDFIMSRETRIGIKHGQADFTLKLWTQLKLILLERGWETYDVKTGNEEDWQMDNAAWLMISFLRGSILRISLSCTSRLKQS